MAGGGALITTYTILGVPDPILIVKAPILLS